AVAGREPEAARRFELAYDEAMGSGAFPPFDAALRSALAKAPRRYEAFTERALAWASARPGTALVSIAVSGARASDVALVGSALRALPAELPGAARDELEAELPAILDRREGEGDERLVADLLRRADLA